MEDPHGEWLDGEELAEQARLHYEDGRLADAEAALRQAIHQDPDRPDWHFNLGRILDRADRHAEARTAYLRCHQLDPAAPEPLLAAAGTHEAENECGAALRLIDQAIGLDRTSDDAHARKIGILLQMDRIDEARDAFYVAQEFVEAPAMSLIAMAYVLKREGDYARAVWCLREALRLEPEYIGVRTEYARCLARMGDHPKALQNYMHVLRESPGDIPALLGCAQLLAHMGREAEAQEKLRRVVEIEPANGDAHHLLGLLSMRAARHEAAAVEFELVLKLDPARNGVRIDLADAQLRRGRLQDARATLRDFLTQGIPSAPGAEGEEAPADREAATEQYRTIIARAGTLLAATGLWQEAARVLALLVEHEPKEARAWRALARARFEAGDLDGGRTAARQTLELDPRCAASYHNLALAALRTGHLDEAWRWVRGGLRVSRTDEGLRRLRSRVLLARLRRALRLGR